MSKPKAKKPSVITENSIQEPVKDQHWYANKSLISKLLIGLAFILNINTLGNDYALDDAIVITDNMFTQEGISGIPGILKYDTFYGFFKEAGKENLVSGGRYRPLSLVTFAIEYELFGKDPFMSHLINLLLFCLSAFILYLSLLKLFRNSKGATAYTIPLLATLLFVVHPIHTEVIANIKGRDEILTLLFSITALYLCVRALDTKQNFWAWIGGLSLFLGLLSKENAITWIAIIPLALYVFRKPTTKEWLLLNLSLWVGAAAFLLIRGMVLGWNLNHAPPMELMNNPFVKWVGDHYEAYTSSETTGTILYTVLQYFQLLIFPLHLTHDYYPFVIKMHTLQDPASLLSLILLIALAVLGVILVRKRNAIGFGILYFLATFSIVSNVFFPIGTMMGERFMYMPSLGFCLIIAVLLSKLSKPVLSFGVGVLICLPLMLKTVSRNSFWENDMTLFREDIKISGESAKLNNAMAGLLMSDYSKEVDPQKKSMMLSESKGFALKALQLHPTYKYPPFILGNVYFYGQSYDSAAYYYQKALLISPDFKEAKKNLGFSYRDAGRKAGEVEHNVPKALELLGKGYAILGDEDYESLRLLGIANAIGGKPEIARPFFEKARDLNPDFADAWQNLVNVYLSLGLKEKGEEALRKVQELKAAEKK
ncbi:MAG: tetratricopeptide repeat protein [Saprospiraceae bacterium]